MMRAPETTVSLSVCRLLCRYFKALCCLVSLFSCDYIHDDMRKLHSVTVSVSFIVPILQGPVLLVTLFIGLFAEVDVRVVFFLTLLLCLSDMQILCS